MVIVMVALSWARAGREKIKTNTMAAIILVTTVFICPSEFDEPLLTVGSVVFEQVDYGEMLQLTSVLVKTPC